MRYYYGVSQLYEQSPPDDERSNKKNYLHFLNKRSMTQLNVYLSFNGNCREAMEFYHGCLGGTLDVQSFGDVQGEKSPKSERDLVMHAKIVNGDFLLMASDTTEAHGKTTTGTAVTLSLNCTSEEEIDNYFAKVSEGGTVTMPLENTFWGAKFGMFTDKFGMHWMMNFDK